RRTSFSLMSPRSPRPTLFPYTTLFRSHAQQVLRAGSLIALANDRIFVVVIHGQNDILVHGGLHKSRPLGPDPLNANHWPSSGEFTSTCGGRPPYLMTSLGYLLHGATVRGSETWFRPRPWPTFGVSSARRNAQGRTSALVRSLVP